MRVSRDVSGAFIAKPAGKILPAQPLFEKFFVLLDELILRTKTKPGGNLHWLPPGFIPS
jgi:hypothetical protein